jgi:hypothetical protein
MLDINTRVVVLWKVRPFAYDEREVIAYRIAPTPRQSYNAHRWSRRRSDVACVTMAWGHAVVAFPELARMVG